ncbi:hypothetical protein V9T40_003083 [Parthenolecanium corni]|uniref:G-protein coupled receptors family 1 profile domain-containing protein n=1 Tax=Parthenolecanium corni TaxID=536013 RepID=A0AAN9TPW8_9HEMI
MMHVNYSMLFDADNTSAANRSQYAANQTDVDDLGRDSLYIIVPMTICYILIFITGIIGNVSTCIVIFYNKYMHTATNFYLFSLAISDLVLLLSALPKEVYELWFR